MAQPASSGEISLDSIAICVKPYILSKLAICTQQQKTANVCWVGVEEKEETKHARELSNSNNAHTHTHTHIHTHRGKQRYSVLFRVSLPQALTGGVRSQMTCLSCGESANQNSWHPHRHRGREIQRERGGKEKSNEENNAMCSWVDTAERTQCTMKKKKKKMKKR